MTAELVAAICVGLSTVITAIASFIISLKTNKLVRDDAQVKDEKLQEIHVLVNSRLTTALAEVAALKKVVTERGQGK